MAAPKRDVTIGLFVQALKDLLPVAAGEVGEQQQQQQQQQQQAALQSPSPLSTCSSPSSPWSPAQLVPPPLSSKAAEVEKNVVMLRLATNMATMRQGKAGS